MTSDDSQDLLTTIDGAVARITFNRPKARNAVNGAMILKMGEFLQKVALDKNVRCVVLTGAGEHFMAGGDVAGFAKVLDQSSEERRLDFERRVNNSRTIFQAMRTMPQPIIARVQGACAGAAVGFAASSDFVIASESALFLVAHVNIGASPDGATSYALPRRIGAARALQMALLGTKVDAAKALDGGLANKVVPDAELDQVTEQLVQKIIALPASSVRNIKNIFNQSLDNDLDTQLTLEAKAFGDCAASPNFIEGVKAFMEKRPAVFNQE